MKKIVIIILCLYLAACVQTASRKPVLGVDPQFQRIGIINLYPNEVNAFRPGFTRFQNKLEKQPFPEWNPSDQIERGAREILSQISAIEIVDVRLTDGDVQSLMVKPDDSMVSYEKRISMIPNILSTLVSQGIDLAVLIVPSTLNLPSTSIYLPGTGLLYSQLGIISAYSSIKLYILNASTNEIIGTHKLSDHGERVVLKNYLSNTEMDKLTQQHEDEQKADFDKKNTLSLAGRISMECTKMERFSQFGTENRGLLVKGMVSSINHSLARLRKIYLGTPLPEKVKPISIKKSRSCTENAL